MQYWLMHYFTIGGTNIQCPDGWTPKAEGVTRGSPVDCFRNSEEQVGLFGSSVPRIANLGELTLQGQATAGGYDTVIFSFGNSIYRANGADSTLGLAPNWNAAEFNVVGLENRSQANFNGGSTIVVRTSVKYGTTVTYPLAPPSCSNTGFRGFTGEKNNLFLTQPVAVGRPGALPAIVFTESNAGGIEQLPLCTPVAARGPIPLFAGHQ